MRLVLNVDGGSRGNPGPAGAGVVLADEAGHSLFEAGFFLGNQTNNAAEYHALIRGLERAVARAPAGLAIRSDSELLVRQLTGEYRVKSERLALLHQQAQLLLLKLKSWQVRHVPREENVRADKLANLAMDQQRDVIVTEAPESRAGPGGAPRAPSKSAPQPPPDTDSSPRGVRVGVSRAPDAQVCPMSAAARAGFVIVSTLPEGVCLDAAHAIVPTALAIMNTDRREFAAVPTLTVRCMRPGCGADFHLSPVRSGNGSA